MPEVIYDAASHLLETMAGLEGEPFAQGLLAKTIVLGVNHFCNPIFRWVTSGNNFEEGVFELSLNAYLHEVTKPKHARARQLRAFFETLTPALLETICSHVCGRLSKRVDPFFIVATWYYYEHDPDMTMLCLLYSHAPHITLYLHCPDLTWLLSARSAWLTALSLHQ
jgi:hypothetical protein